MLREWIGGLLQWGWPDYGGAVVRVTARLKNPQHPNGQLICGGVLWSHKWQTVEMSVARAKRVKAQPLLEIKTPGVVAAVVAKVAKVLQVRDNGNAAFGMVVAEGQADDFMFPVAEDRD